MYQQPTYQTFEKVRRQIFSYVKGFYNNCRIHST
ncbi:IS3 family transposase [Enterococcus mundtii]